MGIKRTAAANVKPGQEVYVSSERAYRLVTKVTIEGNRVELKIGSKAWLYFDRDEIVRAR